MVVPKRPSVESRFVTSHTLSDEADVCGLADSANGPVRCDDESVLKMSDPLTLALRSRFWFSPRPADSGGRSSGVNDEIRRSRPQARCFDERVGSIDGSPPGRSEGGQR